MCGITGVLRLDGRPVEAATLARLSARLTHRGPDDDGLWVDGPVGLGHRRLAIIDLSPAGHQPMSNETGEVWITYNGELYNFQELRRDLVAAGHHFRSRTDTEVVVHAYEEWGEGCLERFNGQFAFAIWDGSRRRLCLARDRFGVKPLYYLYDGTKLLFGSEIKAILAHPGVPRAVCYPALDEYFTFQNIFSDLTLFEGVRLLPAGCSLTVDLAPGAEPRQRRYWDYVFAPEPLRISLEEAAEELQRLFVQAVIRQLMSDVPVGCYLSGGMDSGSITTVARRHLDRLMTFTMGFDLAAAAGLERDFDERAQAEGLASYLGTEHYEMVLHAGDFERVMPELIWHLEDLRVGQCYPNYYIARLAGKFVKVVLSGTGGDELFGGYPWRYARGLGGNGREDYFRGYYDFWQRLVPEAEKGRFFNAATQARLRDHSTYDVFRGIFEPAGLPYETEADLVNASLYFELKTFLHGLLLVEDKVSMAHSLETRVPFLDNDLVDFALRLPVEHKLANLNRLAETLAGLEAGAGHRSELPAGEGKIVLRRAMDRLIPAAVTGRKKQGFSAPDASWFRGASLDYVRGVLGSPRARLYDHIRPEYVTGVLAEHASGRRNHRLLIWSLLSFEWWLDHFLDDPIPRAAAVAPGVPRPETPWSI